MTNFTDALGELVKFMVAVSSITSLMTWRRDGPREDQSFIEASDYVLDSLSDADKTSKIELHNARNIRDQLTIEQVEELYNEKIIRSWTNRN